MLITLQGDLFSGFLEEAEVCTASPGEDKYWN
jgi:hypothetical protein